MVSRMKQSRREFLKTTATSGAVLILSQIDAVGSELVPSNAPPADGWQLKPGKARYRFDGLPKVTGKKIYARDFRAKDLPGWPAEEHYVHILRATFSDHIFDGIDLSGLSDVFSNERADPRPFGPTCGAAIFQESLDNESC